VTGCMNEFEKRAYELVAAIPSGKVLTYGQIALLLGNPSRSRHVGRAMSHAPESLCLPCHRVVNAKGEMSPPEVFGAGIQRHLLESEGVPFRENGCVDWKRLRVK
jgi:methylated-DNA-protein-cysteine methyltransferase-like protein